MGAQESKKEETVPNKPPKKAEEPPFPEDFVDFQRSLPREEYLRRERDLMKLAEFFVGADRTPYVQDLISDNIGQITFKSVMGTEEGCENKKKAYPIGPDGKRLKPCCACPETKRARDTCVVERGEENCTELIEAHKACMRSLGFNI